MEIANRTMKKLQTLKREKLGCDTGALRCETQLPLEQDAENRRVPTIR